MRGAPRAGNYAERPLWHDETPPATDDHLASLPVSADVVVVGAGYCGLSAATELARRGRDVVVVEADPLGFGASTRNAGMVIPELRLGPTAVASRFPALAPELGRAALEACRLVEAVVRDHDIACDYRVSGGLQVAHHPRRLSGLRATAEHWNEMGLDASLLIGDALRAELDGDCYVGGVVLGGVAALDPAKFHAGLVRRAVGADVTVRDSTRAEALDRDGTGWRVRTRRGDIAARDVFVAANAEVDGLVPSLGRRILPVGSFMIATEPLPAHVLADLIPHDRMVFDTRRFVSYWRRSPDDRLVFGGRRSLGPTSVAGARDHLYRRLVRVYPQIDGVAVARAWGGRVAITRDRLPHCGRIDGVAFAAGCNGTGIALATWLGVRMASWIADEGDLPAFARLSFERHVPGFARPVALPVAGWGLRGADRIGR